MQKFNQLSKSNKIVVLVGMAVVAYLIFCGGVSFLSAITKPKATPTAMPSIHSLQCTGVD